jgi:hypothetical protein
VPQEKLAVDVTVGDLLVVSYCVLAVIFLARRWTAPAEERFDGDAPERIAGTAEPAAEGYASDFGRTYPSSVAQPGPSSDHSQSNDSVARAPVGNLR